MSLLAKSVLSEAVIVVVTNHFADDDTKQHHPYPITDTYQVEFEGKDAEDFIAYVLNYPRAVNTSRCKPE
jgi:hypothetical protein